MSLESLISDVLSMVKERHDEERRNRTAGRWEGGWTTGQEIDERRKHKNALELEKQASDSATERQGMVNTSQENIANINNVGQTARQRLIGTSNETVAGITSAADIRGREIGLEGTKRTADVAARGHELGLEGVKYNADTLSKSAIAAKKTDPNDLLFETWGGGNNPTPESLEKLRVGFNKIYAPAAPEKGAGTDFYTPDEPAKTVLPVNTTPELPVLNPKFAPTVKQPVTSKPFNFAANIPIANTTGPQENTLFTQNPIAKALRTNRIQIDEAAKKRKKRELELGR